MPFLPRLADRQVERAHRSPGTLTLTAETLTRLWYEIGESVARAGVRKLVILDVAWRQRPGTMEIVARELRVRHRMFVVTLSYSNLGSPPGVYADAELRHSIHAGDRETSLMMHARPDLVRDAVRKNFVPATIELERTTTYLGKRGAGIGFAWQAQDLNPDGACGDASLATAEKGRLSLETAASRLVELLREVEAHPRLSLRPGPLGARRRRRRLRPAAMPFAAIPDSRAYRLRNCTVAPVFGGGDGAVDIASATVGRGERPAAPPSPDLPSVDCRAGMAWPAFIDLHAHIDKAHISNRAPNPEGSWLAALETVRADRLARWTAADVEQRMDFAALRLRPWHAGAAHAHRSLPPQAAISWRSSPACGSAGAAGSSAGVGARAHRDARGGRRRHPCRSGCRPSGHPRLRAEIDTGSAGRPRSRLRLGARARARARFPRRRDRRPGLDDAAARRRGGAALVLRGPRHLRPLLLARGAGRSRGRGDDRPRGARRADGREPADVQPRICRTARRGARRVGAA